MLLSAMRVRLPRLQLSMPVMSLTAPCATSVPPSTRWNARRRPNALLVSLQRLPAVLRLPLDRHDLPAPGAPVRLLCLRLLSHRLLQWTLRVRLAPPPLMCKPMLLTCRQKRSPLLTLTFARSRTSPHTVLFALEWLGTRSPLCFAALTVVACTGRPPLVYRMLPVSSRVWHLLTRSH